MQNTVLESKETKGSEQSDQSELFSLKNQSVLLTGACGLIGREVADALCGAGASVAFADIQSGSQVDALVAHVNEKYGSKSKSFQVNVAEKSSVERLAQDVCEAYGKIDVLINCAALDAKYDDQLDRVFKQGFESFPLDLWQRSFDVNVTGMFLVCQAVIGEMLKLKSGNIINVGSLYSLVAPDQRMYEDEQMGFVPKPVDYIATKSFVPNFTRYLATYYAQHGIRANTIVPHGIFNNHEEKFVERFAARSPMSRMCQVSELRGPFVFLASKASSYMTGSTLVVDGGWTAW